MPVLFHETIFGPVHSRRLGYSLGINLLPTDSKICSFNCIYCECGWNPEIVQKSTFANRNIVFSELEERLKEIKLNKEPLDVLTFAGNGEPTLHPEFLEIVEDVISLRDKYFPYIKIAVLSNSTMLSNSNVVMALKKIDLPILKLDSVVEKTFRIINNPPVAFNFNDYITNLKKFNHRLIVQTMFLRGEINGSVIDNTTNHEIDELIKIFKEIKPESVMIYSLDRQTPAKNLIKISSDKLTQIANKIKDNFIQVHVTL
jgi:wyosine [tRNA(Phe)-imidazoG37] synthetase (radical SAM superfamily)